MRWHVSNRFDRRVLPIANRHYNRKKPESPQFAKPGRTLVLATASVDAFWISTFQQHVEHAWPGAWECSAFRNENRDNLSSELIREAVAATYAAWGEPGPLGFITFVDGKKVRRKRDPGRCFRHAGFVELPERTKDRGLVVLQLAPARFPPPAPAIGFQLGLDVA